MAEEEGKRRFRFTGVDSAGNPVEGEREAEDSRRLFEQLRSEGIEATSIEDISPFPEEIGRIRGVGPRDVLIFTRQLSDLVKTGLPIPEILRHLSEELPRKNLEGLLIEVMKNVEDGKSLSQAFSEHPGIFPEFYVELIRAGEEAGSLAGVLEQLADRWESQLHMKNEVRNSFLYPCILSAAAMGLYIMVSTIFVRALLGISQAFFVAIPGYFWLFYRRPEGGILEFLLRAVFFWILVVIFLGCLSGVIWPMGGERLIGRLKFHIPLYGTIFRNIAVASFCRSLGILISKKVPMPKALTLAGKASPSRSVRRRALRAARDVSQGTSFSECLQRFTVFPVVVRWLISAAEKRGRLAEELLKLAKKHEEQALAAASRFAHAFELILILIMGVLVASQLLAVYITQMQLFLQLQK